MGTFWATFGISAWLSGETIRGAKSSQLHQAWESRFGGPLTSGGGAAIGSVVSAVGAGLIKTSSVVDWIVVVVGVFLAIAGSVFSANNYVRNRSQRPRFLRLLHDIGTSPTS